MPDFNKIYLYRMTHIDNVPHILTHGITHVSSANTNKDFVPIGDNSLINSRNDFIIPNSRTLGDYIPFYFGVRMPMLYVIQNGFNGVKATSVENIIYCVCSIASIIAQHVDFIFTDGHAVDLFSSFYNATEINNIETTIDSNAIARKYWIDDKDLDIKRRKEAEFLAANDIPAAAIIGYVVYNERSKEKLNTLGIDNKNIVIKPNYYF